jgi:hypothetical protein
MTKEIQLVHDRGITLVDDDLFEQLDRIHWYAQPRGYVHGKVDGRMVLMHRYIMDAKPGQEIDHIDRNKINNQKSNLRFVTRSQNCCNKAKGEQTSTPYLGVYRSRNKYAVSKLDRNKVIKTFGVYDDIVLAAEIHDEAARRIQGEFAVLNFPNWTPQPHVIAIVDWYLGTERRKGQRMDRARLARLMAYKGIDELTAEPAL